MAFSATFLGHQGWLLRSDRTTWLIDPLLREDFGDIHALDYRVYPPRTLDLAAFPEVDAVFLTHEHDDHFDIPSLAMLDRAIPVFLSARSSSAARQILETMGFVVVGLEPGVVVEQGDLELVAFAGDHVTTNQGDEWDALPFSVRQTGGDGSFFSMVDVALAPRHLAWARAHVKAPGLVTWSNNTLDLSHMDPSLPTGLDATGLCLSSMQADHAMTLKSWGRPAATLVCAGGFSFSGERAWLNETIFTVDVEAMCERMRGVHEGHPFVATVPGQTFCMEKGEIVRVDEVARFLRTRPRAEWPPRNRSPGTAVPDYAPATRRRSLPLAGREALEHVLTELAATLVGGVTFRSLHSLLGSEASGRRLTFALALRRAESEERLVYEYDASSCAFRLAHAAHPERVYLAGLTCWASDLLAVLRGELGAIAIQLARARVWNALPRRFRFDIFEDLYRASHPLRRPAAFLRTYDRVWRGVRGTTQVVRAHRLPEAPG